MSKLRNFLEETDSLNFVTTQVDFIFIKDCKKDKNMIFYNYKDFAKFAKKTNYDNGYGTMRFDGVITFKDSNVWYERNEYDGAEWWQRHKKPCIEDYL